MFITTHWWHQSTGHVHGAAVNGLIMFSAVVANAVPQWLCVLAQPKTAIKASFNVAFRLGVQQATGVRTVTWFLVNTQLQVYRDLDKNCIKFFLFHCRFADYADTRSIKIEVTSGWCRDFVFISNLQIKIGLKCCFLRANARQNQFKMMLHYNIDNFVRFLRGNFIIYIHLVKHIVGATYLT